MLSLDFGKAQKKGNEKHMENEFSVSTINSRARVNDESSCRFEVESCLWE